eukprot:GILK01009238.1.p1 GENE.GILK01009238.1~~GILK01009238.1.p1  ORF type:complete len:275 (-),score=58.70 GILK01009238.1:148-972(-)
MGGDVTMSESAASDAELQAAMRTIVASVDMSVFTLKMLRRELEKHFKLAEGSLDEQRQRISELYDKLEAPTDREEDGQDADDESEEEEEDASQATKKRKRAQKKAPVERKRAKKVDTVPKELTATEKKEKQLKSIVKDLGLGPAFYKGMAELQGDAYVNELTSRLIKSAHNLGLTEGDRLPNPSEIALYKRRREKQKELEGIDKSRIIQGSRRTRGGNISTGKKQMASSSSSSSSGSSSDDSDSSSSEEDLLAKNIKNSKAAADSESEAEYVGF